MEAATPLRPPHVTVLANRVIVDGLVLEDATVVELVRARAEAGDDPSRVVADAVEIGARVLDREQAGANAEFVKTEFEKVSREVESAFTDKARVVAEFFGKKVDEVFHEESGHLSRSLERHFSDGSSAAVQHRVKEVVAEVMTKSREDLMRQFSSADASNPLAQFQRMVLASMSEGAKRQDENLRALLDKLAGLEGQVIRLQDEKQKQLEVAAEADRGTAKGRTFEEAVAEALDRIAVVQGDDCDAVGDTKGATRRTGDIVVALEGCRGPARGRIVFEAKTARLGKRAALDELDRAREERGADYAVLVVPNEEKVPAKLQMLREYNGDKLVVCYEPEDGSTLALEVAYSLARARVLMAKGESDGVDVAAVREAVERATGAMGEVQRIKQQLTGATTSIEKAREIVDAMAAQVRGQLAQIEALLEAGSDDDESPAPAVADAVPAPPPRAAAAEEGAAPAPRVRRAPEPPPPGTLRLAL
ncbi:MAG TPA: DUF2130 domain-containing protein [Solirubrobacteraceae bacterium]|jgi:hypothetical protein